MNVKKFAISTLVVGFTMWVISGLWHNLILPNFYSSEIEATHEGIGLLLIAYLILGLFMAYMYPLGYKGGRPAIEGLRFGIVIGLLWILPHGLAMAGAHGESISYVLKNATWHAVEQGLGGIVLGLIYGLNPTNIERESIV